MAKRRQPIPSPLPRSIASDSAGPSGFCGIEIRSEFHCVAVPENLDSHPIRKFDGFTDDLSAGADLLLEVSIMSVPRESTGVSWVALLERSRTAASMRAGAIPAS